MFAKFTAAAAAIALSAAPTIASAASANPAASLSVAKSVRASTPTTGTQKAAGGSIGVIVVGVALLVGFGFLIADNVDDNDSDSN